MGKKGHITFRVESGLSNVAREKEELKKGHSEPILSFLECHLQFSLRAHRRDAFKLHSFSSLGPSA